MAESTIYIQLLATLRRGGTLAALPLSKELVDEFPAEFDAHVLRLRCLGGIRWFDPSATVLSEFDDALDNVDRLDPGNPYGQKERANALRYEGHIQESIDEFSRILGRADLSPAFRAWVLRGKAESRIILREYDQALQGLEEALRLEPTFYYNYTILSAALLQTGRTEEALTTARQAVALAPEHAHAIQVLGRALIAGEAWEDAAAAFGRACELAPSQWFCAQHAYALLRADQPEEARSAAATAQLMEDSQLGTYWLACYSARAQHRDDAIAMLKQTVELGFARDAISLYEAVDTRLDRNPDFDLLHGDADFEAIAAEIRKRVGEG